MDDEEIWRRRFPIFIAIRLFAVICVVGGMAVWLGDFVRPGGWPLLGGILVAIGLIDGLVAPRLLKRYWDRQ